VIGNGRATHWAALRRSPLRHVLLLVLDAFVAAASLWLAMLLRFDGVIRPQYLAALSMLAALLVGCRVVANSLLRLHRWSFRFAGLTDAVRVGLAGVLGTGLWISSVYFLRVQGPPRSVIVMEFLLSTVVMGLVRYSPRLAWMYLADRRRTRHETALRTVILGAGAAGDMLLRDLIQSHEHGYRVIGFLDDDERTWGTILGGRPVLGDVARLPELVERLRVEAVLIAIPRLPARRVRDILNLCANLGVRFKILPVSFAYLNDRVSASMLQDLSPEDLLPRDQVHLGDSGQTSVIVRRRVLVTGAAGSIGSEICRQLAGAGAGQIVMVDINENGLYLLKRDLEHTAPGADVCVEVGDIRDAGRMRALFTRYQPQDVFHAAAHKHVPLMEASPCEAVKNNVLGTLNVARAAEDAGAERFVFISTDKAVRPSSVMGATKRVGEKIIRAMAQRSATRFCAVRFGNVLGSDGSVVPLFRSQIARGGPVTVTHPEVRRYFMTTSEAVGLVLKAGYADYGTLCVLDMGEQLRISDLARHMVTMAGMVPEIDIPIVYTGLRPGEKLSEELLTEEEEQAIRVHDKIFMAQSPPPPEDLEERISELAAAAAAEEHERAVVLLRALVPSYVPSRAPLVARGEPAEAVRRRIM
jgi:FlaA1/EpsC-like NDP-sugar epimerase